MLGIYDYILTIPDEVIKVWQQGRWSVTTWLSMSNRYLLLFSSIVLIVPHSPEVSIIIHTTYGFQPTDHASGSLIVSGINGSSNHLGLRIRNRCTALSLLEITVNYIQVVEFAGNVQFDCSVMLHTDPKGFCQHSRHCVSMPYTGIALIVI